MYLRVHTYLLAIKTDKALGVAGEEGQQLQGQGQREQSRNRGWGRGITAVN